MNRRTFIKTGAIATAGTGLLAGVYTWQVEPFWLEFVWVKMPVHNLPPAPAGKTLMQISDLQIGNRFNYQYITDSLKKAQQLRSDFVVYTGDFVSYENEQQFEQLAEVSPRRTGQARHCRHPRQPRLWPEWDYISANLAFRI